MRKKRMLSMLLAATMGLTGCGNAAGDIKTNRLSQNESKSEVSAALTQAAIAQPVYPETPKYPREEEFFTNDGQSTDENYENYDKQYQAWNQHRLERIKLLDGLELPNGFFKSSTQQFLAGEDENRVFSPVNIYMALAMLTELTDGESRAQILKLLESDKVETIREQANKIWNALYNEDGTSTVTLGSSIWLNDDIKFNAETMKRLAEIYYASSFSGEMGSEEFNKALQDWLNEQTHGLLTEQAGGVKMNALTVLALATAMYFKAPWVSQFEESATTFDTFHAPSGDITAPFMHKNFDSAYYIGDGFSAVPQRLQEGEMWLILPDKDKTISDLIESGAAMDFIADPEKYESEYSEIQLSLPKFDISSDLDLIDGLKALGVTDVFDVEKSDFTPMTTDVEQLKITQAKHAARVKIDEEGCEAAAFTVMMVDAGGALIENEPVIFTFDRPFLFAVTDMGSLPLFVGAVNTPADDNLSAEQMAAYAIDMVEYPTTPSMPNEEDFVNEDGSLNYEDYNEQYQEWSEHYVKRTQLLTDVKLPEAFFKASTQQFLAGDKENRVCSPVNIYMALAMLCELTDGESRAQILKLLESEELDAVREQANKIWNTLYNNDGTSITSLGSSIWLNDRVQFNEETMKRLAENFYASSFKGEMGTAEFNKALQTWLNQQTHGLLTEQASELEMDALTILALATAIYFKAPWESQFDESATIIDTFHAPDGDMSTPFMKKSFESVYYTGDDFSAVPLNLAEGQMWLVLPNENKTVNDLIESGAAMDFIADPEKYERVNNKINVSLPKFDISSDLDLIDGLKAMGITDVFDVEKSDFTPMTTDVEQLEISQAKHAARVKIDEEGCEAAAFTVMMMRTTSALLTDKPIDFTLDRPFLFVVTDMGHLPLFVGAVNTPEMVMTGAADLAVDPPLAIEVEDIEENGEMPEVSLTTSVSGDYQAAIMVNDKMYYSTNQNFEKSQISEDNIIGYTSSYSDTMPSINGETNFIRKMGAPYAKYKDGIAVLDTNDSWLYCLPKE